MDWVKMVGGLPDKESFNGLDGDKRVTLPSSLFSAVGILSITAHSCCCTSCDASPYLVPCSEAVGAASSDSAASLL